MAVLAIVLGLLLGGSYARRETVTDRIIPASGLSVLTAARQGVVTRILVKEGDTIVKGDPIAIVSVESRLSNGAGYAEQIAAAAQAQSSTREDQIEGNLDRLRSERDLAISKLSILRTTLERFRNEAALQAETVRTMQQTVDDLKPALEERYVAVIQYRQYVTQLSAEKQRLSSLQREVQATLAQMDEQAQALSGFSSNERELRAKLAEERAGAQERQVSISAENELVIASAIDGDVLNLGMVVGKSVSSGSILATIAPHTAKLKAELWAPSSAIGFLKVGQQANLMYDPFPYQRFGIGHGVVEQIASAPSIPDSQDFVTAQEKEFFRVVVAIDRPYVDAYERQWSLRPGMRLTSDLILERRSFFQWIFDPLRATWVRSQT